MSSEARAGGNWFLAWKPRGSLDWIADLRHGAPQAIRWFHPEDCHVTLAFFGRLSAEKVEEISTRLATIPLQQIVATIGKPLLLPSPRRFSALAFSIESDALRSVIAENRDEWMALADLSPESRDPLPHLTFARPDRRLLSGQVRAIRGWMETLRPFSNPAVTFEGPMLFTWSEDRAQRQFKVMIEAGSSSSAS